VASSRYEFAISSSYFTGPDEHMCLLRLSKCCLIMTRAGGRKGEIVVAGWPKDNDMIQAGVLCLTLWRSRPARRVQGKGSPRNALVKEEAKVSFFGSTKCGHSSKLEVTRHWLPTETSIIWSWSRYGVPRSDGLNAASSPRPPPVVCHAVHPSWAGGLRVGATVWRVPERGETSGNGSA
jgi:hypothetical protein